MVFVYNDNTRTSIDGWRVCGCFHDAQRNATLYRTGMLSLYIDNYVLELDGGKRIRIDKSRKRDVPNCYKVSLRGGYEHIKNENKEYVRGLISDALSAEFAYPKNSGEIELILDIDLWTVEDRTEAKKIRATKKRRKLFFQWFLWVTAFFVCLTLLSSSNRYKVCVKTQEMVCVGLNGFPAWEERQRMKELETPFNVK